MNKKLSRGELTRAFALYARKHGFSVGTVRACTSVRLRAISEFRKLPQEPDGQRMK